MFHANRATTLDVGRRGSGVQRIIGRIQDVHEGGASITLAVLNGVGISETHLQVQLDTGWHGATSLKKGALLQVEGAELVSEGASCVRLTNSQSGNRQAPAWTLSMLAEDYSVIVSISSSNASDGWSVPPSSEKQMQDMHAENTTQREEPRYKYTSVNELLNFTNTGALATGNIHLFAVVVDCTAPCATNKGDFWCEVVVADDSSAKTPDAGGELKTIAVQCCEKDPGHCIPFRAIGDIICIESLKVDRRLWENRAELHAFTGRDTHVLLWTHEGKQFTPLMSKGGVQVTPSLTGSMSLFHNPISRQEQERIRALRSYSRAYVLDNYTTSLPNVKTVVDVNATFAKDKSITGFVDLLCRYVEDCKNDPQSDSFRFIVSHGLSLMTDSNYNIIIDSQQLKWRGDRSNPSFSDFYPSWKLMSRSKKHAFWLLIRDLQLSVRGSDLVGMLSVGYKTSTLVWYPESSALVQNIIHTSGSSVDERSKLSKNPSRSSEIQKLPTAMRIKKTKTPSPGQRATAARRARIGHSKASSSRDPPRSRSSQSKSVTPKRQPQPTQNRAQRTTHRNAAARSNEGQHVFVVGGFPARKIQIVPTPEQLRPRPPRSRMVLNTTVITSHSFQQLDICSLAEVQQIASNGVARISRIRVSAKGCVAPRDVRFACKPWCVRCKRFLKIDSNHRLLQCVSCEDTFSSTGDPRTQWAFCVRLILEDECGDRVEGWIEGDEGIEFFSEFPPRNLLSNLEARQAVKNYLAVVMKQTNIIDCCVLPQEYQDVRGKIHRAFKVVGTTLISGLLRET